MELTGRLLDAVAQGNAPNTMRVFRPGSTLAFGRSDRARRGFAEASRVASAHGWTPVVRWGGGHAAAYDFECLIVEVLRRHELRAVSELENRFLDMVDLIQRALAGLGVNIELGELEREYCPGRYSLHLPSGPKVAGAAQRVLTRASLTTAVVVVGGANTLRETLADVYEALGLPLDIRTVGAITDRYPDVNCDLVQQAIIDSAAEKYRIASPRSSAHPTSKADDGCDIPTETQVDERV